MHGGFYTWIRSLGVVRAPDRWFGGVAGGVAARTGLDPVLVRGLFVVLGVFGVGFLLYGAAWALLPEPDGRIHVEEAVRGNWTSGMTGALVFAVLGTGGPGVSFIGIDGWFGATVWTLFWIAAGVGAIYWFSTSKEKRHQVLQHFRETWHSGEQNNGAAAAGSAGTPGTPPAGGAPGNTPVSLAKTGLPPADAAPQTPAPAASPLPSATGPSAASPSPPPTGGTPAGASVPTGSTPASKRHTGSAKVPGAPGAYLAAVFGAALLAGGAVLTLDYVRILDLVSPLSVALAATAAVLGLGVVVLGLAGRHSGGIGSAAVAALIISFLAQPGMTHSNLAVMSSGDWTPKDTVQASGGYTAIAGNGKVDLRETDASGDYEVPVSLAAGNISILVPEDSPVTVRFTSVAGNVQTNDGTDSRDYSGLWQASAEHTLNGDADGDRITIDIRGLAGNVRVTTEESDL